MWQPALDLAESEKEYLVKLEAPGMAREDFEVLLDGTLLTLSGKREMHRQGKGEEYLWVEREEGRFMRTVRLPGAVQEGKIDAVYHDGILTVRMPKAEPPVKNRIAIK
jgi:HSP20 family protein